MQLSAKKKLSICLVSQQLSEGGAERCAALLSTYLENNNCSVSHIIVLDKVEYQFAGTLYNLGKFKNSSNGFFNRLKRFKEMKRIFKMNDFDCIVDFRLKNNILQEYLIAKLIYNAPLILSVRSFRTEWYFPKSKLLTQWMYADVKNVVTVSEAIAKKIKNEYHFPNVQTITNALDFTYIDNSCKEKLSIDFEYVLAVGRLDEVKQFEQLISAYSKSILPSQNTKLLILGDGHLKSTLKKHAESLNLEGKVIFNGNVSNPFPYMVQAKALLLSSKNEGFPNVIIEALACNTPVISFDCLSGPSYIITPNINGILVENQNFEKFTEAMNSIVTDKNLYLQMKNNARKSVFRFSIENIGNQWLQLFENLKNENRTT